MAIIKTTLFTEIENIIGSLNIDNVTNERREILKPLIDFIQSKAATEKHSPRTLLGGKDTARQVQWHECVVESRLER